MLAEAAAEERASLTWPSCPHRFSLGEDEVHLFRVELTDYRMVRGQGPETLDRQEQARAARFYRARDRQRWTMARVALKSILARILEREAGSLSFEYGPQGKPFLPGTRLCFNLSHAHEMALVAVAWQRELGIDVEWNHRTVEVAPLARRFLSASEQSALFAKPLQEQHAAFLRLWTRKEAFIKAIGQGLSLPLDCFDVSLDQPPRLLAIRAGEWASQVWRFEHLAPAPDYVGAVVAAGSPWRPRRWSWRFER